MHKMSYFFFFLGKIGQIFQNAKFHLLKTLPRVLSGKHAQGQENKLLIFHLHLGLWLSEGQKKKTTVIIQN